MSTNYYFVKKIPAGDFFDGRLEKFGVREHHAKDTTEQWKCLTVPSDSPSGASYLWVYIDDRGFVGDATWSFSNGGNGPVGDILHAIAEAFDTDIFDDEGSVLRKLKPAHSVYGRFAQRRDPYAHPHDADVYVEYPEE